MKYQKKPPERINFFLLEFILGNNAHLNTYLKYAKCSYLHTVNTHTVLIVSMSPASIAYSKRNRPIFFTKVSVIYCFSPKW
jgi:hypothetical protein